MSRQCNQHTMLHIIGFARPRVHESLRNLLKLFYLPARSGLISRSNYSRLTSKSLIKWFFLFQILWTSHLSANPTLNDTATNAQVVTQLEGPGVTISNFSVVTGIAQQFGTFTGGDFSGTPGPQLGIDQGVFMITGLANAVGVTDGEGTGAGPTFNAVKGPNDAAGISSIIGTTYTDTQLTGIDSGAIYDPIILQMQAVPIGNYLKISFVFASDEYPEFVCSVFNDAFGMFIKEASLPDIPSNWINIGVIPGTTTPIAVNTINSGACGAYQDGTPTILTNTQYYVDNGDGTTPANNTNLQYDGFTVPFTVEAPVSAGTTYDVKIAIADAGDAWWDGALFVKWLSSSNFSADADLELDLQVNNTSPNVSDTAIFTITVDNKGQDAASGIQASFPLPAGFSYVSDTSGGNYNPVTGIWTIPGSVDAFIGSTSIQITTTAGGSGSVSAFAEISTANVSDVDSTPGNGSQSPVEDDEDTITISVTQPAVTGPTICTGATLPANAVTLSFADFGIDWPVNTYTPQTFTNIESAGVDMMISVSDSSTFSGVSESNTNTGNGDTAPFFITTGLGAGTSTFTLDLAANPSSFVDLCTYHINQSGGGDRIQYRAITNVGTILTQPTFGPASVPSYNLSSDTADAFTYTTILDGLLGVNFQAPTGELIERVELIWSESSGSVGGMHGLGFGEISFDAPPSATYDYGDAPVSGTAPDGSNTNAYGEASHTIVSGTYLGGGDPDADSANQPTATAGGDDSDGSDDEDSITTPLPALSLLDTNYRLTVSATNTTAAPGRLIAWLDFDGNGTFETDEAAARVVPAGTTAGNFIVTWAAIPPDIQTGQTYLRVRFTTDAMNANEPNGAKSDGEVEDYPITIVTSGVNLSGRVYIDANSNAIDDGESGIGGTVVVLRDTVTGSCRSVTTSGNGDYSFAGVADNNYEIYQAHGETTPLPQNCGMASANNPTGYQSTTPDTLTVAVTGVDRVDQDFGEVAGTHSTTGNTGAGIAFEPDHQSEILPGNTTFYAHTLTSDADGAVRFNAIEGGNATSGWTHLLYRDSDCNGTLNGTEGNTTINGMNLAIAAGGRLCVINKVYAPANVPAQDRYDVKITAAFTYAGGTVPPATLTVTDITTSGQTARLKLTKTVENLTQTTPETETLNQAKPGDFLKYRIYYRNTGIGPITDLKLDDTVPAYTGFVTGSNTCDVTPSSMTCAPIINIDELSWNFTGSLAGGASGNVSYEVRVGN